MFATSGDILNMALAFGFIVLVIFLCVFLFYGIIVLRDVSKVTDRARDFIVRVHKTVTEPLRALDYVVDKVKPYVEAFVERKMKGKKK